MSNEQMLSEIEQRMALPNARGLATAISRAVGDGVLADGDRLPPIRTVADQLGLSPTTVSAAWALLGRTGTIATEGRRGTIVTAHRRGPSRYRTALASGRSMGAGSPSPFRLDLSTGAPDPVLLPDIAATLGRIDLRAGVGTYLDEPVLPRLHEILDAAWPFAAEQITVVDGAMDALGQTVETHLRFGDRVAVEHPSFPPLLDLLDANGITALPVDVDDDGPLPEQLAAALAAGAQAFFLQPRAQNPTGATLTQERVAELERVLQDADAIVVEDDSAGEISLAPPISLGAALPARTLRVLSFSKAYGPDLRIAAIGGPAALVQPIVERRFLGQGWTSRLLQSILLDLVSHPSSVASIDRARHEYARRRSAVVSQLAAAGIEVGGKEGLNIWVPVPDEVDAQLVLATHGIAAASGRPFSVRPQQRPYLRVTTGLVTGDITAVVTALTGAARAEARPPSW